MQQVLAFAALIVPGFISLRVYELRCGTESRKANESLVDVIVYSFATDVIGMAALSLVALVVPPAAQPIARACVAVAVLVVLPMTIAFVWSDVQRWMVRYGVFREAVADPWDHIRCGRAAANRCSRHRDAARWPQSRCSVAPPGSSRLLRAWLPSCCSVRYGQSRLKVQRFWNLYLDRSACCSTRRIAKRRSSSSGLKPGRIHGPTSTKERNDDHRGIIELMVWKAHRR